MDKILLLQVEKDKFYDKDGNEYRLDGVVSDLLCSLCAEALFKHREWYLATKSDSVICFSCTTVLTIKEVLEAQLFKIKLEKQRQPKMEIPRYKQRSTEELAKIEQSACFIYEGFAHYDEVTSLYRRPYWTDLCNADKEQWYHTAERYQLLKLTEETS